MSPHARAINFLATVIGWCVLGGGGFVLAMLGLDALKAATPAGYGPVIFLAVVVLGVAGLVYGAALDFAKCREASEKADQERRRKMEDELLYLRSTRKEPSQ